MQPIIGYYSDRTWNWLGRRRPYFLAGAVLASLALIVMPRSPMLWMAAGMLWILDASINIAMEPFRAFVGDQLPERQRPAGYSMQSFFIGVGAVVASLLPWMLAHAGVSNVGTAGAAPYPTPCAIPSTIGAVVLAGRDAVDHLHDARVSARRAAWIRGCDAACRRRRAGQRRARAVRGRVWVVVRRRSARCSSGTSSCDRMLYMLASAVRRLGRCCC